MVNKKMTDPITDMLNRIRNAQGARHQAVDVPYSEIKNSIAKIMEENGFVEKVEKKGKDTQKEKEQKN